MVKIILYASFLLFYSVPWSYAEESPSIQEKGLVLYYDFEEGDGEIAHDKSRNKNDGKITGATWTKGANGTCLKFDGVDDYIDCGSPPILDIEKAGTIELWYLTESPQGGLVSRSTGGSWNEQRLVLAVGYHETAGHYITLCLGDGTEYQTMNVGIIDLKVWTHIAVTYDGSLVTAYKNGYRIHGGGVQNRIPEMSSVPFWIGRVQGFGKDYFNGLLDEVRIYNRVLSEEEILKHYNSGAKGRGELIKRPDIMGSPVSPEIYKRLTDEGFLPTSPEMSDLEIAEKLNLDLPDMADVKSSVEKNDPLALERSLAGYLNRKLPPRQVAVTGKPYTAPAGVHQVNADDLLKSEITIMGKTYPLGEKGESINWYSSLGDFVHSPQFEWWYWSGAVCDSYVNTGDVKYAERILTFVRSFYHRARPPAGKANGWSGPVGPWFLGGSQRIHNNYLPYIYQLLGASPVITDTDRVMFLKMFYEHAHQVDLLTEEHRVHNFEPGQVLPAFLNVALLFPEFRDSSRWLERILERYTQNIQDCILDDGGAFERTGYHYAYEGPYGNIYRILLKAGVPLPEAFKQRLEKMYEWSMWLLAPTLEFPMFGHGNIGPMTASMEHGVNIFPDRADFAYLVSGGKKGQPPSRVAKVLSHTGWLTMRSDWSRGALYMALNYNGSPGSIDGHDDLLSFGLWADGWPYMTNSGTTASYGHPEEVNYNEHTISANTVMVDNTTQDRHDNDGRLESWASMPAGGAGFTYLSAVSDAYIYKGLGVSHRRAILFIRPDYWLIYDLLSGDERPHTYHWLGHFQPTELTVDNGTKAVSTSVQNGKRLWLIPAEPESFTLEQKTGAIDTRDGTEKPPYTARRKLAPYISLIKKDMKEPTAFTVLLYPGEAEEKSPVVESLKVRERGKDLTGSDAAGCRIIRGAKEDIIGMAKAQGEREYGKEMKTDGEMGYVRLDGGKVIEAGLYRGRILEYRGKRLIEAGADIESVYLRSGGEVVEVSLKGNGEVAVLHEKGKELRVNGKAIKTISEGERLKFYNAGSREVLEISEVEFSTKPEDLGKAIGIPKPLVHKDMVVVTWQSSFPSDATIEYCKEGEARWLRSVNPEPTTNHRMVLSRLMPGEKYKIFIRSCSEDGRVGKIEATYIMHP